METVLVIVYLVVIFLSGMTSGIHFREKRLGPAILYTIIAVLSGWLIVFRFVS